MVMIRNKNNVGWNKNKWNKKSLKKWGFFIDIF
jgi:hypothetical protein